MKSLVQYIHEAENLRPVVIYGGKFQPFHSGHYEIYEKLVNEFGKNNVFISTSDINKSKLNQKAYSENHIFTFDEKVKIMETMFNIPSKQIIKALRTPYLPSWREIPIEGSNYAYITVCGMKDKDRFDKLGNENMIFEQYKPGMKLQSCLDHKYYYIVENEKINLSATEVRNYFREHNEAQKIEFFKDIYGKFNQEIFDLVNNRINRIFESLNDDFIVEGKVAGHIQHLHNDMDLTFEELEDIIDKGFSSNLEQAVEKVDGNPLAMTYRNGEFLFAWNGDPKNIDELELEFFRDLPKKVYRNACERLIRAFKDNPNTEKWFEGKKLLHMEILASEMPNMIKYNRDAIVFHYVVEYDDNGKQIGKDRDLAVEMANQLSNNGEKIEIIGPPFVKLKDIDCTKIKNEFISKLNKMIKDAGVDKNSTLLDYMISYTKKFLSENDIDVPEKQIPIIAKKWLGLNKTHQYTLRTYKSQRLVDKLEENDSKGKAYITDIYNDIKVFIASICVEILKNMKTYVATDIQDGANDAKKILNDAIKELNSTGELSSSEKLSNALKRIEKLGIDNLFPSEGILFVYKDRMYKITGMFADYIALSDIIRTKKKNNEYN